MFTIFFIVAAFILPVTLCKQEKCPGDYLRLSSEHSFCLPANQSCFILVKGLQDETAEKAEILEAHNEYRSRIAIGEEKLGGGLPEAANMLQLTWDKKLHEIAQKWAEQCEWKHDCNECRATKSFPVGQNIAYEEYSCQGECEIKKPDWKEIIKRWYDEVAHFDKKFVSSPMSLEGKIIGHFSQVSWAETWKLGCGYVAYKNGNNVRQYYVCNYGPAGNVKNKPMYIEGKPCSKCPSNSCCKKKYKGEKSYPGLCYLKRSPPIYPLEKKSLFYTCGFELQNLNCIVDVKGGLKYGIIKSLGGRFLRVIVKQQVTASLSFRQLVRVKKGSCMILLLRKGPNVAGEKEDSNLEVEFDQDGQKSQMPVYVHQGPNFFTSQLSMNYEGDIKFSFKFSVPAGAPEQFLEIKKIQITTEACD